MRKVLAMSSAALLAACSANEDATSGRQGGAETVAEHAPEALGAEAISIAVPQLVYRYSLRFQLPEARLAATQESHHALCQGLGPARCQLVALTRGDENNGAGEAQLKLRVATAHATYFTGEAARQVVAAGGTAPATNVNGEDVSKDLSDTAARIRQREVLVARLTEMLRTRKGSVSELVDAERSVAAAQEELDKARAWLGELRGRISMAEVDIRYQPLAAPASGASVGAALGMAAQGSAATFVWGMQALLSLAIYLLPWAAVFAAGATVVALLRRRTPAN